jgi:fused signal recognition particle receptor
MGAGPAGKIRDSIRSQFRGRKVMMSDLIDSARETIREIMEQEASGIQWATTGPTVIMVVGVNGSGKTTSIAKLTYRFISEGKSVVLGAGDTFRAAAVEQLGIWAERLGAKIVTGKAGSDPASVAYKAVEAGLKEQKDVVIVDTAGRLQTQTNLMDELSRIRRVIAKLIPEAPHEVLLVLDSTAGQNAISQAKGFSQAAGCTGIVLAKLDGTAKGGVAIPIRQDFGLPVKFIGLGETPDAFADFNVEQYVAALFDVDDES